MVKAEDIMRKNVVTIEPSSNMDAIAKIMSNNKIGSVVILEGETPTGIVTNEDVVSLVARGKNPKEVTAAEYTQRNFFTASPEEQVLAITKMMIKNKIKRVPIIKEGKLQGIVTDKEILVTAPELIDVLSEKLKARVERVAHPDRPISGICENCEGYSDNLPNRGGRWLCGECRS